MEDQGFGSFLTAPAADGSTSAPLQASSLSSVILSQTGAILPKVQAASTKPASALVAAVTSMPPAPETTLERMRAQSSVRQHHFKEVECFECGHSHKVSRSTKSVECSSCSAFISCEDLDINLPHSEPIRTRGDVTIRKHGVVTTDSIFCRDLTSYGNFSANTTCQGNATFKNEGVVAGTFSCRKLTLEKGADFSFSEPLHAGDMFINGRIAAQLIATGKIVIGPYGAVDGDVTARAVSIEPGGELNGSMSIVSTPPPAAPTSSEDDEVHPSPTDSDPH
jgi:cytoskeletal protein CcmA (bactofilin family)/ribosomal protein S27E